MTSSTRFKSTSDSRFARLRRAAGVAASASALALAAGLAVAAPGNTTPAGMAPGDAATSLTGGGIIRADDAAPTGWAAVDGVTNGGAGAPAENRYEVGTLAELKTALANHGEPKAPKIIYVRGTIDGNQTADGRILGEQDYAPGYDINKYMSCFGPEGKDLERPDLRLLQVHAAAAADRQQQHEAPDRGEPAQQHDAGRPRC